MEQGIDLAATTIDRFLDDLASASPTPGGGAAAALTGAMGAALVSMVCRLTIGRPRYAAVEEAMTQILAEADNTRARLLALAEDDARAYGVVAAAYKLSRSNEAERQARAAAIQAALKDAVDPPLAVTRACRALLPLCLQVAAHGNTNVVSDAGVAGELAAAGVRGSILNVRINLSQIADPAFVAKGEQAVATAQEGLEEDLDRVVGIVRAKLAPKARP